MPKFVQLFSFNRATAPVQNASEGFEFVELLIGKPVFRRVTTPPTTRLSEKERRAISFRIPGPGDGAMSDMRTAIFN